MIKIKAKPTKTKQKPCCRNASNISRKSSMELKLKITYYVNHSLRELV